MSAKHFGYVSFLDTSLEEHKSFSEFHLVKLIWISYLFAGHN